MGSERDIRDRENTVVGESSGARGSNHLEPKGPEGKRTDGGAKGQEGKRTNVGAKGQEDKSTDGDARTDGSGKGNFDRGGDPWAPKGPGDKGNDQ